MSSDIRGEVWKIFGEEFGGETPPKFLRWSMMVEAFSRVVKRIVPLIQPDPPKDRENRVRDVWQMITIGYFSARELAEQIVDSEPGNSFEEHQQSRIEKRDSVIIKRNETIIGLEAEIEQLKAKAAEQKDTIRELRYKSERLAVKAAGPDRLARICERIRGASGCTWGFHVNRSSSGSLTYNVFRQGNLLLGTNDIQRAITGLQKHIAEQRPSGLQQELDSMGDEYPQARALVERELKGR